MPRIKPLILRRRRSFDVCCPYCHDPIHNGRVTCSRCGARHHSPCAEEHPACATCGESLELEVRRVAMEIHDAQRSWLWAVWSAFTEDDERPMTAREWQQIDGSLTAYAILAFVGLFGVLGLWLR